MIMKNDETVADRVAITETLVVLEAENPCMRVRGVEKPNALTVTSAVRGTFKTSPASRAEAMALLNRAR
jgi:GTP cyclohydrolase I